MKLATELTDPAKLETDQFLQPIARLVGAHEDTVAANASRVHTLSFAPMGSPVRFRSGNGRCPLLPELLPNAVARSGTETNEEPSNAEKALTNSR